MNWVATPHGEKNVLLSSASESQRGLVFNHTVLPGLTDGGGVTTARGSVIRRGVTTARGSVIRRGCN